MRACINKFSMESRNDTSDFVYWLFQSLPEQKKSLEQIL